MLTTPTITDAELREMRLIAALCHDDERFYSFDSLLKLRSRNPGEWWRANPDELRARTAYLVARIAQWRDGRWPCADRCWNVAPCTLCGAQVGERCVTANGLRYYSTHAIRASLASLIAADIVIRACESERKRRAA